MKGFPCCASCSCGNIECFNIESRKSKDLFISSKSLAEIKDKKLIFSLLCPKSLVIHNQNLTKISSHCGMAYEFHCLKCEENFYVFPSHSKFSVGYPATAQIMNKEAALSGDSETPNPQIPIILRPFIHIIPTKPQSNEWELDEIDPIDIDDEYMFSPTKNECIIGSYEDRPMHFHPNAV